MDKLEAIDLVRNYLSEETEGRPDLQLIVLEELVEEHDFGWVFYYDSKKHLETGDFRDQILGNAPLIVDKDKGEVIVTGTAHPTAYYVDNYMKYGDPHVDEDEVPNKASDLKKPSASRST